jgi:diaminopropionate ammonia-lyase
MLSVNGNLSHFVNPAAETGALYPQQLRSIASLEKSREAIEVICQWPGYRDTPLHSLDHLSSDLAVAGILQHTAPFAG